MLDVAERLFHAVLFASLGVLGCAASERPLPPACTLEVTAEKSGRLALAFLIVNPKRAPESGSYGEPFTDFELTVTAGGKAVAIEKPAPRSKPAVPRALDLPFRTGVRLVPPVRLQFAPGGQGERSATEPALAAGDEELSIWTLAHPPGAIELRAKLTLEGLAPRTCVADYRPPELAK